MPSKISPELKAEILALPAKEKDKLLIRLIPKANNLVEQLAFKLLENEATTESRREEVSIAMDVELATYKVKRHHSTFVVKKMRALSGPINHHVAITKDKYGQVELSLKLLIEIFDAVKLDQTSFGKFYDSKFYEYVVKRLVKELKVLGGLHEDYHLDFSEPLESLFGIIDGNVHLSSTAEDLGLDYLELEYGNIPEQFLKN